MKYKILFFAFTSLCSSNFLFAQSEKDQPPKANPKVIEVGNHSSAQSSPNGKELPANSHFKFDYRFFIIIQQGSETITGHFDLDSRTGTIRSTRDDMPKGSYILRTPANKIYTYAEAEGKKILMEMNKGDNAFDVYFDNIANSSTINFRTAKKSDFSLKKVNGDNYSISEQTISAKDGFAVLYTAPLDFAVHTGGSFDPISGLGIIYDYKEKRHHLIAKIESEAMTASISAIRKINSTLNGADYTKMSGLMNFSEQGMTAQMKDDINTYKKSNNTEDILNVADIYAGGDVQMQIDETDKKIAALNDHLSKKLTPEKKSKLMEEKRQIENVKITLTRHLTEIKNTTPAYWKSNMNAFMDLKARQAQELVEIKN